MPYQSPRRDFYGLKLTEAEALPVRELAAQLPPMPSGKPNLSAALRQIIAEWAAQPERRADHGPGDKRQATN